MNFYECYEETAVVVTGDLLKTIFELQKVSVAVSNNINIFYSCYPYYGFRAEFGFYFLTRWVVYPAWFSWECIFISMNAAFTMLNITSRNPSAVGADVAFLSIVPAPKFRWCKLRKCLGIKLLRHSSDQLLEAVPVGVFRYRCKSSWSMRSMTWPITCVMAEC